MDRAGACTQRDLKHLSPGWGSYIPSLHALLSALLRAFLASLFELRMYTLGWQKGSLEPAALTQGFTICLLRMLLLSSTFLCSYWHFFPLSKNPQNRTAKQLKLSTRESSSQPGLREQLYFWTTFVTNRHLAKSDGWSEYTHKGRLLLECSLWRFLWRW